MTNHEHQNIVAIVDLPRNTSTA